MNGLQEMGNQRAAASDHLMNGYKYENEGVDQSDSFIVDLESYSNGTVDKEPPTHPSNGANSRITFQRSLSRKVPQRGTGKINDRNTLAPSSSPRAAQVVSTPEKSLSASTLPMGSLDNSLNNPLPQHQITIKTGSMNTIAEGKWGRRPSFKRSPATWFADPKRILLFFATLSSMGTMLLIYFTLSVSKHNDKEGGLDWQ